MSTEVQTTRREIGRAASVLYLLRHIYEKTAPEGTAAGQRSRSIKIIGKLALKSPPLVDLEHFLVRLSKAKRVCLNGSTEPAVVEIVNELLCEKLKS